VVRFPGVAREGVPVSFLDKLRPLSLLLLRCMLGFLFIHYGYPKIAHGITGTERYMAGLGLPSYFAYISVALEVGGGALLILGLATRPVALLLTIEMCVAMWKVDLTHGWGAVDDYRFTLAMGVAAFALATFGAGSISLDSAFFGGGSRSKSKPKD
jgi:putative oxidoreductase